MIITKDNGFRLVLDQNWPELAKETSCTKNYGQGEVTIRDGANGRYILLWNHYRSEDDQLIIYATGRERFEE